MSDFAVGGDHEELGRYSVRHADANEPVLRAELTFQHGRDGSEAMSCTGKFAEQCVVLEFAEHEGTNTVTVEPLVELKPVRLAVVAVVAPPPCTETSRLPVARAQLRCTW